MYYNYDPNDDFEFEKAPAADEGVSPVEGEYHYAYVRVQPMAVPAEEPKTEKKKKGGLIKLIAACLVCAILGGLAGGALVSAGRGSSKAAAASGGTLQLGSTVTKINANISNSGAVYTAEQVYGAAVNSVVGITTEIVGTNIWGQTTSSAASGTGFIISEDGYILTNNHVIESSSSQTVMLYNGESYDAKVIAADELNDVAVLKIEASGLTPVTIGDSDTLNIGQTIYVIGNPLGELTYTLTGGLVSALDRAINTDGSPINMFQIDAAVNAGNSGGPVLNASGEVVGVVTAKYSSTGVEGLGFALPINDVLDIAEDLMLYGYVTGRPYFGITVTTVSESAAEYYDMVPGAYVKAVDESSCAGKAGLQNGDIITAIDGEEVLSSSDVITIKAAHSAGDTLKLTVWREGEYLDMTVVLDEQPAPSEEESSEQDSSAGEQEQQEQQDQESGGYFFNPFSGLNPFSGTNPFSGSEG